MNKLVIGIVGLAVLITSIVTDKEINKESKMDKVVVGQRLIHYSGGYGKAEQDGTFTTVTAVTPTGRFRITADNEKHLYYPDTMKRIGPVQKWSTPPYCRLINKENKKLEERALCRLWIRRLNAVDFENLSSDQLKALIGTLNTLGIGSGN